MKAVFSPCGTYRYTLHRRIPCPVRWMKPALFLMLNPSTADDEQDDPTIRRCIGFATAWGCSSLTVVNLFALRSTDPKALAKHADPIGPDNNMHIHSEINRCSLGIIVAAWGAHGFAKARAADVIDAARYNMVCLGRTKDGAPRHPLYVPAKTVPEGFA